MIVLLFRTVVLLMLLMIAAILGVRADEASTLTSSSSSSSLRRTIITSSSPSSLLYANGDDPSLQESTTTITTTATMDKEEVEEEVGSPQTRIAGGQNAPRRRYPYYVALRDKNDNFRCGGSLIAPNIVLTAAHCQDRLEYVVVGLYSIDTEDDEDDDSERINIIGRHPHPLWFFEGYSYDQMILVLERPSIHPTVRLNLDSNIPASTAGVEDDDEDENEDDGDTFLTLIGMGRITSSGPFQAPTILQETKTLRYIDNDDCRNITNEETGNQPFADRLSEDMICVLDTDSTQCSGDSGGPYLLTPTDRHEDDVQVGLVSWSVGNRCSSQNVRFPGVGARTSTVEWIRALTCQNAALTTPENFFCFVDDEITFSPAPTPSPIGPTDSPAPTGSLVTLTLTLYMDDSPHEVAWKIESLTSGIVYGEVEPFAYVRGTTLIREHMQVPAGEEYRLTLEDSFGDGIDPKVTQDGISYDLVLTDEDNDVKILLLEDAGDYSRRRTIIFIIPTVDQYPTAGPTVSPSVSMAPSMETLQVFLRIDFDDWHKEISWKIVSDTIDDNDMDEILPKVWASADPGTYTLGGVVTEIIALPANGDRDFALIVRDNFGDGFEDEGDDGNGYILYVEDPSTGKEIVLVEGGGAFGSEALHPFSVSDWTSYPTDAPSGELDDGLLELFDNIDKAKEAP